MSDLVSRKELIDMGNRQVNITYVLCGCLESSFEDMNKYLEMNNQGLRFNNKKLFNEMVQLSKRFRYLVDELQTNSVLTLSDNTIYAHDVSIDIFYSMMMKFIMLTGVDDKYDFRAYSIWALLDKYQEQITFPKQKIRDHMAWNYIRTQIENGALNKEVMKVLLPKKQKDESRDQDTESKVRE